ncbi:hypothetical protein N7456_005204 [Penicillium angulare]|uniref:Uncharacterized protein n=1 Tax=Penicillium angulare TaxID=116970 RepID=A0A9W9FY43_9EURO|nr:hypothetical protein N7456_005204 [Penicillium angulare]
MVEYEDKSRVCTKKEIDEDKDSGGMKVESRTAISGNKSAALHPMYGDWDILNFAFKDEDEDYDPLFLLNGSNWERFDQQ